jgi:hypothetical protein
MDTHDSGIAQENVRAFGRHPDGCVQAADRAVVPAELREGALHEPEPDPEAILGTS